MKSSNNNINTKKGNIKLLRYWRPISDFYLLQIDQEKPLNKIDKTFLYKTIEKIGISPLFITFIKILYKQNTSMIINNGYLSPQISLQRGLRERFPLSCLFTWYKDKLQLKTSTKKYWNTYTKSKATSENITIWGWFKLFSKKSRIS